MIILNQELRIMMFKYILSGTVAQMRQPALQPAASVSWHVRSSVWWRSVSFKCTKTSEVPSGYVSSAEEVSVELETTASMPKLEPCGTITVIDATIDRTGLAGMARINSDHAVAFLPSLVVEKEEAWLGKAPTGDATVLLVLAALYPFADVRQVIDDDNAAGADGINDMPIGLVVRVALEPGLFGGEPIRMPLSAPRAFVLRGTSRPKVLDLELILAALSEGPVVWGNRGTDGAVVHTDNLARGLDLGRGCIRDAFNAAGHANPVARVPGIERGQSEANTLLPPSRGEHGYPVVPPYRQGAVVMTSGVQKVVRNSHLAVFMPRRRHQFDYLCGPGSGLRVRAGDKLGPLDLKRIAGRVMQDNVITFTVDETAGRYRVEDGDKLAKGFNQDSSLLNCRLQERTDGSTNAYIIPYVAGICSSGRRYQREALGGLSSIA
jgi:hypothetical protein